MSFTFTTTDFLIVIGFAILAAVTIIPMIYNVLRHTNEIFTKDETPILKDRKIPVYGTTIILVILLSLVGFHLFNSAKDFF